MFRLPVSILLVGITFGVVHSFLIKKEHGTRIEGDTALYSRTQITNPTVEPTIHGIAFDWVGLNQTFTQILFEMSSYQLLYIFEEREFFPPYIHRIIVQILDLNVTSLLATMTVYGFSDKTHLDVHPFENQNSLEPFVNMVEYTNDLYK